MTQQEKDQLLQEQREIVLKSEAQLSSTDYIASKIAEGVATKEEYADKLAQRQQWRNDINNAKERIREIEAEEVKVEESHDETVFEETAANE